jgi:hypothetical protein
MGRVKPDPFQSTGEAVQPEGVDDHRPDPLHILRAALGCTPEGQRLAEPQDLRGRGLGHLAPATRRTPQAIAGGGISLPGAGFDPGPDRAVGQSSLAPTIDPAAGRDGHGRHAPAGAGAASAGVAAVPPFLGGGFAPPMGGAELGGRAGAAAWRVGEVEEFGTRRAQLVA